MGHDHKETGWAGPTSYKRDLRTASIEGLEATIQHITAPHDYPEADQSDSLAPAHSRVYQTDHSTKRVSFSQEREKSDKEVLNRLEGLEAEIRMSVVDTNEDSFTKRGVAGRSHDQAGAASTAPVQWSHDCTQTTIADSRLVTSISASLPSYWDQKPEAVEKSVSKDKPMSIQREKREKRPQRAT